MCIILLIAIFWAFLRGVHSHWLYVAIGSLITFLVMVVIIALIGYLKTRRERALETQTHQPNELASADAMALAAEVEPLKERIKELEAEKAASSRAVERFRKEAEHSSQLATTHSIRANLNQNLLEKYKWLHEYAAAQQKNIAAYVKLEPRITIINQLNQPVPNPCFVFELSIVNHSVFDVVLTSGAEGWIRFSGQKLRLPISYVNGNSIVVAAGNTASLLIEQPLTKEEVEWITYNPAEDYIKKTYKARQPGVDVPKPPPLPINPEFYFDKLQITIEGAEGFPDVKTQRLKTDGICVGLDGKSKITASFLFSE